MSNELTAAYQVSAPSGVLDAHMLMILAIMMVAGLLGGAANYYLAEREERSANDRGKYLVLGVVAALTVPLFLNMMSSTLLEGARTKPVDFFAFAGFCLVYVIASRRWFENAVQRLLGQVEQVRKDLREMQQEAHEPSVATREEPVAGSGKDEARDSLSYNDVEILRAIAEENFVYGNLAAICERTGLAREFVSQRLTALKAQALIETRINDKNVLHWTISAKGRGLLGEILDARDEARGS
ncbi:YEATS-associated helix-containing protein [Dechloromonas sp. ZY10]|uniref:YEATS-associated helix-containing protein n=1 Tax=Dechloromonas aquae TaxID=2664436 RepID=UPI0035280961